MSLAEKRTISTAETVIGVCIAEDGGGVTVENRREKTAEKRGISTALKRYRR